MKRSIESYSTLIFDCDGVVLDSNAVKTRAFYETALEFGQDAAEQLVAYHKANGGVSRFKKFDYFLANIVKNVDPLPSREELVEKYARKVREGLVESRVEPNIDVMKRLTPDSNWLIVSGGAQDELRWVFSEKGIDVLFEGGIFGSPDSKEEILDREITKGNIVEPALFIGDSKYDYLAAKKYNIDFLFIKQWTEFAGWSEFCCSHNIIVCEELSDILKLEFD
ncbi:Phosphoglycolate phosphatase, HAD superfamily [Marinobacter sp. es.048]|uniref:HAD family hydrolase n=1 Tax=Marinobacter sp. es.048 TaxID=1761795 RepID=UPI000B5894D1|nr:HAD family hydrolase [Marinobacter sp. es.048]SNC66968.1 Phosphoglycolate phosphatase, HAD superfamily [Marinobacter sp. es.048]